MFSGVHFCVCRLLMVLLVALLLACGPRCPTLLASGFLGCLVFCLAVLWLLLSCVVCVLDSLCLVDDGVLSACAFLSGYPLP